jgi:hypothetical protein
MLIARLIADIATRETSQDLLARALREEGVALATAEVLADGDVLEMRFTDGENDQFIDGFCVICGGRYSYALEQAPPAPTFFVRLDDMGPHMPAGIAQTVIFSIPLDAAPRSVARIDELNDETISAPPAARLTAAPSMAAFSANPHASYFHDPAARRLHLQADARWLVISR